MKEDKSYPSPTEEEKLIKERKKKKIIWTSITAGIVAIVTMILLLIFLIPRETKYEIELNSNITGVVLNGQGEYKDGEEVTIVAEEIEGYRFIGWSINGNIISTEKEYTFVIGEDTEGTYVANYEKLYEINIVNGKEENVTEQDYILGDEVRLVAEEIEGYRFIGWEYKEEIVSEEKEYTFKLTEDKIGTYTAKYQIIEYTVTLELSDGEIEGGSEFNYTIESEDITLAKPTKEGYEFIGWTWEGQTEPQLTATITKGSVGNRKYTANYEIKSYNINKNETQNGSFTVKGVANYNEIVTLEIIPNSGCEISEVYYIKNGSEERHNITNIDGQYSFVMPNSDITIYVVFSKINYQLATEINNGEILGLSSTAQTGENVTFTVETDGLVEDKYYGVERVYYTMEDGQEYDITSDNNVYTFTMPSGNITLHVDVFEKKIYLDYVFDDDSIVSYVGDETEITIPSSYSKVEVPFSQVNSQTFSNYQEFTNSSLYKLWIYQSGYFYLVEDEENILITDFYEFENKMSIDDGPFTIKYENYQFTAEEMDNALQVAMLVNISKGYSFKLVTNDNEIIQIDNITIDNLEEKFNETKELLIQKNSFPVQVQFNDIANISVEGNDYLIIDIGLNAFYGNANLQKVNFESDSNIQTIGERAFGFCDNLVDINLPSSIIYIDNTAFDQSNKIEYYYDDNNDKYLGNSVNKYLVLIEVKDKSISSYNFKNGIRIIFASAFSGCTSLTSVTLGENVTSIGYQAFQGCTSLTSITLGKNVTSIDYAFSYNFNISEVYYEGTIDEWISIDFGEPSSSGYSNPLSNGAKLYLKENEDYKLVTEVTINQNIKQCAFYGCTSLTSVTLGENVTSIGDGAFSGCYALAIIYNNSNLTITKGSIANGYIGYYAKEIVGKDSQAEGEIIEENNVIYYKNGTTVIAIGCSATSPMEIILRYDTTEINKYAFYNNKNITSINIPNSVRSIGSQAFYNCTSLTSVTIGENVTSIGSSAFSGCTSLTSITLGENVTSIGNFAFYNCTNLASVEIKSEYVYKNVTSQSDCGYILQNAQTVKVLKTIVDKEGNTNSYLNDTSNFTKTEEGDYYIYTKVN